MLVLLALLACNKDKDDGGPVECQPGASYSPGQTAFVEASEAWGLVDIDAIGTRMNALDFDGDGWVDLMVRQGDTANDFAGTRTSWLLRNTGAGSFEDVTEASGLVTARNSSTPRPAYLWAFGDVDNDGDLDVYTGFSNADNSTGETAEIMLSNGDGTFALGPEDSELRRTDGDAPSGASFIDVNLDGYLDLWIVQYVLDSSPAMDRLYLGDGSGAFTDVTDDYEVDTKAWSSVSTLNEAGSHSYGWGGTACDLNNDGLPELLAMSYGRAPNLLWRHEGGVYSNQSVASGYAFDDRQDWSDNESARCWCTLHPTDDDCEGIPEPEYISCNTDDDAFRWDHDYDRELFRLGGNTGTTVCADLDNDGWQDLVNSEIRHWDVGSSSDPSELLHNTGSPDIVFERPGNEVSGLTVEHDSDYWDDGDMTGAVFDFDNDGWKDVYIGSSDYEGNIGRLYHQVSPLVFEAVDVSEGIDQARSHGIVHADFDNDGDLDVVVGHGSSRCEDDCYDSFAVRLFENVLSTTGNWIDIELEGATANRSAIGARVEITTPDGQLQVQEVGGGYGQWTFQNPLPAHFGLGTECEVDATIGWPDGSSETFSGLVGGAKVKLVQGTGG